jgi:hypothetical protein
MDQFRSMDWKNGGSVRIILFATQESFTGER